MLVLLSFALVLVATVLLVLGLLNDDGLTLIYISIASSVAAAVVLMIALRLNKPKAGAPAPARTAPEPEPVGARTGATAAAAPAESDWLGDEEWGSSGSWAEDEDDVDFPIADYDDLTVAQILPLLPQLYADEIGVVEARERAGKARPAILDKLAQLRRSTTADEPTQPVPAAAAASPSSDRSDDDWFPIENYESLSAAQIRPLIGELDDDELVLVREKEQSLGRRPSVLYEIDRRLGTASAPRATSRTAARSGAGAKKASAKKSAAKRSAAKKTTAKKATAKKAPAKKAAAKKASPAKKAAAKKTAAKKKAAPAKKAAKKR